MFDLRCTGAARRRVTHRVIVGRSYFTSTALDWTGSQFTSASIYNYKTGTRAIAATLIAEMRGTFVAL